MIPLDLLLKPVSVEKPSGDSPEGSGDLFRLEQMIRVEAGAEPEVEPEWDKVRESSLEILKKCKDLRVAVILSLACLRKDGLSGLAEGLQLIKGLVDGFWDSLHPRLDSDDPDDDPTRANTLNNLSPPIGKEGDYRFVRFLRSLPLSHSPQVRNYCLRDHLRAEGKLSVDPKDPAPTPAQMAAAFQDSTDAAVKGVRKAHRELLVLTTALEALEEAYTAKCGDGVTPSFEVLRETLAAMVEWVTPFVRPEEPAASTATDGPGGEKTSDSGLALPGAAANPSVTTPPANVQPRAIASSRDVETALRAVLDYYKTADRASPVPFLVERALRVLDKDFLQAVTDLGVPPDGLKELAKILGPFSTNSEKK